jgi:sugar/nucleoside kinase (ribokinase family)
MKNYGLFVGLVTLDLIYQVNYFPTSNEKIVASNQLILSGGPATNASVTFSSLGNQSKLLGVFGNHPLSQLIRSELGSYPVELIDLAPDSHHSPTVSSIIVTSSTGERAAISVNATKSQIKLTSLNKHILDNINIILIDGHQMVVSEIIANQGKNKNIPVVIDGGSWKSGYEKILPFVDYAICSANFYPPYCHTPQEVVAYLKSFNIPYIAITQGEKPIQYWAKDKTGEIPIPKINVVDTLGAGDIFHGAFCHYILQTDFIDTLIKSAKIASYSCQFYGTRNILNTKISSL